MTSFDYSRAVDTANRLIERFGKSGHLRRYAPGAGPVYNPGPPTPANHPVAFAVTKYRSVDIDGSRVLATDKKVLLARGTLSIAPTTEDVLVEPDGALLKIIDVQPLEPGDTIVVWILQARR